ncbi:peroxiredoxin family protein [Pseudomonadota bacterium]
MSCVKFMQRCLALSMLLVSLSACDLQDDLLPSDSDKSGPLAAAVDFTVKDVYNNDFVLSDYLAGGSNEADVVVLYFTMWCPVCLDDTYNIHTYVMPQFEGSLNVIYGLVDYVSGTVDYAYATAQSNGYLGSNYEILADVDNIIENQFNGSMGTTIVIDNDGSVLMNEDYKYNKLVEILNDQLPLP